MPLSSRPYAPRGFSSGFLPPGVKWLLVTNSAIFLAYFLFSMMGMGGLFTWMTLVPAEAIGSFQIWRLFTYMFLHAAGDPFHLLINMLMLYMFGAQLENTWGTRRFLNYYFLCGIGAGICVILASYLFSGNPNVATLGASGAIFGLLLAFGIVFADATILVLFLFPMSAKYAVMIYGVVELYFTLRSPGDGVSHVAHLGGMIFGYLYLKSGLSKKSIRGGSVQVMDSLSERYQRWKLARAKKKFEVYMRKNRDL